jgi:ABC-2 type transport system ATP-binding protein
VWEALKRLSQRGSTIVLTTHYLDEAEALADRLYIVDGGRVLTEGTAEALKQQAGGTLRVSLRDGARAEELFAGFGTTVGDGEALHVITSPDRIGAIMDIAVRERLAASVGPVTLEEAFLRVVGHSIEEET